MSDTTVINPFFKDIPETNKWISLALEVEDVNGLTGRDTLRVRFSRFTYLLGYEVLTVYNDRVQFAGAIGIEGGIAPLTFVKWSPEEGLGNPYDLNTKAKPWENTNYNAHVKDSIGCTAQSLSYEVRVVTTGLIGQKEISENCFIAENVLRFDNPGQNEAVINVRTPAGVHIQEYRTSQNVMPLSGLRGSSDLMIISVTSQNTTCSLKIAKR